MKYKVIGWTYYEDYRFKDKPMTFASRHAIIDEIKAHGYRFSGYEHQEYPYGCPVLNDGSRILCSQRGFGGIMAEAYGEGAGAYAMYMMTMDKSSIIKPEPGVDRSKIVPKSTLREEFTLEVSTESYIDARANLFIELDDRDELRYIDKGDTLVLTSDKKRRKYKVVDVDRKKSLTEEEQDYVRMPKMKVEEVLKCNEILNNAPTILKIKLR